MQPLTPTCCHCRRRQQPPCADPLHLLLPRGLPFLPHSPFFPPSIPPPCFPPAAEVDDPPRLNANSTLYTPVTAGAPFAGYYNAPLAIPLGAALPPGVNPAIVTPLFTPGEPLFVPAAYETAAPVLSATQPAVGGAVALVNGTTLLFTPTYRFRGSSVFRISAANPNNASLVAGPYKITIAVAGEKI